MNDNHINIPLEVNVIVLNKKDTPAIEVRKHTNDKELIKAIVSCAFRGIPLIVQPRFTNQANSINSLIQNGIIYLDDKDGQYYFTF